MKFACLSELTTGVTTSHCIIAGRTPAAVPPFAAAASTSLDGPSEALSRPAHQLDSPKHGENKKKTPNPLYPLSSMHIMAEDSTHLAPCRKLDWQLGCGLVECQMNPGG